MRFINQLLPLLQASSLPAHVISVYGAGLEAKLFQDDLSLREPGHYSFANCRSHVVYMKTLFMEALAKENPGRLSLVHVFPGLIITEAFDKLQIPKWAQMLVNLSLPVFRPFTVAPKVFGERVLFLASSRFPASQKTENGGELKRPGDVSTSEDAAVAVSSDGIRGGGAYAVNQVCETIPASKSRKAYEHVRAGGLSAKVWEHTMKAFSDIEAKGKFTE